MLRALKVLFGYGSLQKDEDYPKKYKKQSMTGSGLFALLPTPKNDRTLVPRKVMQQIVTSVKKPVVNKHKIIQKEQGKSSVEFSDSEDDSESNGVDFFSLTSKDNQEVTPEEIKLQEKYNVDFNPPKTENAEVIKHFDIHQNQDPNSSLLEETKSNQEPASSSIQLDEMALVHLCGSRAKRRKSHESMEIIDVDGAALIPDANDWLTKELTQEQNVRRNKRKGGPTSQQRRKHQITYLAFQAKENELELKNQWANNRMTRKQTQAKYGF